MQCSPDGKLIAMRSELYNPDEQGYNVFFKVIYPTKEDSNYYLNFSTTIPGRGQGSMHTWYFLKKKNGLMWFVQQAADFDYWVPNLNYRNIMVIYVFDGMSVYKWDHELPFECLINEERSSSW